MVDARPRVLPTLTEANRPYWTSGQAGRLTFPKCATCAGLVHPPMPRCPHCRGAELALTAVDGTGTVVGATVNHQIWNPLFTEPFSYAVVALDADPRVRITTNVVGCAPEAVHVGMRVRVAFEAHGEIFVPVFEPTGEADGALPVDDPAPDDYARVVRPMLRADKYESRAALTGIGMSQIGRRLMRDPLDLAAEACTRAVADAGLTFDDIDGIATYPGTGPESGMAEGGVSALEDMLRLRPTWYNGGGETFGPAGSITAAMLAIAGGLCRHVLCVRTVWAATHTELMRTGRANPPSGSPPESMQWALPYGWGSAAMTLAMSASYHFAKYGTTRETLGWIAVTERANAARNPTAVYRDPMTMDDYFDARMISTPFGLYDCDVPADVSVAVVVSAVEAARDLAQRPVLVEAAGTQMSERVAWDQSTLSHEPQVLGPAAHLWTRTDLRPTDVDVALLYDGFTFNCVSWLEALGFCGIGEAKDFLAGGTNIAPGGVLPLNPHGGQLSAGRSHGMGFVHEAVTQLRGSAGERQVPDARTAVVSSGGLTPSGVLLLRTE